MDIIPLGHSSFKVKGKTVSLVCDPYEPEMVGLKFPRHVTADIVTISHDHNDHANSEVVENPEKGNKMVFSGPGEYECKGVEVYGIDTYHDGENGADRGKNTVFKIRIDGITLVHLGDLGHKLTEDQEEMLDDVDILFIPVGGKYSLDAETAAQVVAQLEPSIVIPMHYLRNDPSFKIESLQPVSSFLKEMGKENIAALSKLNISKDKLPEETEIVVLE